MTPAAKALHEIKGLVEAALILTDPDKIVAEACLPFQYAQGAPPPWDSPLGRVWQTAVSWTLNLVGEQLGATRWNRDGGSEDVEGDMIAEIRNLIGAAGLVDAHGDPLDAEGIRRLVAAAGRRAALGVIEGDRP